MKTRAVRITITAVFHEPVELETLAKSTFNALQAPNTTFPRGMAQLEVLPLDEAPPTESMPPAPTTLN